MPSQTVRSSASRIPHELKTIIPAAVIILAGFLWNAAAAGATGADPGASMLSISGFGTFGLVHSSEDNADFTANLLQPNGAGYTHSWSPDVDSRLGAQVIAHFTPQLSAMLQVISEQSYDNTYQPHVEWANIAYQPTPEFSVRVGRIVLPTFLLSDSRKVTEASDVFSLGAIAFHLFASRPPAGNPTELAKILRDQKGLSISSVLDGAGPKLEELIQWSTHPDVLTRIGSVEDFLTLLAGWLI